MSYNLLKQLKLAIKLLNEIEIGKWANQDGISKLYDNTLWGSHFQSICNLLRMFNVTCKVINTISKDGLNYSQWGDTKTTCLH